MPAQERLRVRPLPGQDRQGLLVGSERTPATPARQRAGRRRWRGRLFIATQDHVFALRIGVLASGTGTILEAILSADVPVAVVVVDRPRAASRVAKTFGVAAILVERTRFRADFDRWAYSQRLVDVLKENQVQLVVMAGFGTVLAKPMFEAFGGFVLNTHPSLLPSFPGWHAVRDALDYGVKVTGVTVNIATLDVDSGPILAQEAVHVLPDDDEPILHERLKVVERRLYPETILAILKRGTVQPSYLSRSEP